MEEKVLHEVRIIETEDGYRIEIKGDKEQIREQLMQGGRKGFPFGMLGSLFGGGRRHQQHRHHGPFGHRGGPFGRHGRRHGFGPWGWDEQEKADRPQRGPAADTPRY